MSEDRVSARDKVDRLMEKLEEGVSQVFESDRYAEYLSTMSKFHRYSFRNTLLIYLQSPGASCVAGYRAWETKFGRHVKRNEKGIQIFAPCTVQRLVEQNKLDESGQTVKETVMVKYQTFKVATVFDISQTEGRELPTLGVRELTGSVEEYHIFQSAIRDIAPVEIRCQDFPGQAKGCYHQLEQKIYICPGMSQMQTVKTLIHETAHAMLHALPVENGAILEAPKKDRRTREVEAESVAYVVCRHFGMDTSDYSFGYVAGWSKGKELPELKASLDCIRNTAARFIDEIERRCPELAQEEIQPNKTRRNHDRTHQCK